MDYGKPIKQTKSALDGVAEGLSALTETQAILRRAKAAGFDWPDIAAVMAKLDEEVVEFKEATASGDNAHAAEELGDVLFVCADLADKLGLDAEGILRAANAKFTDRFKKMEAIARQENNDFNMLSIASKLALWRQVKKKA